VQFRSIGLISGATAIALSAAYLGDAEGWSLAAPMIWIGLLLILAPIKALPSQRLSIGLAGLLASAMLGFFPGSWFGSSEWYLHLRHVIPGLPLTLSLQPRQTLLTFGPFLASTLYGTWLIQWHPRNRIACLQLLVAGIAILAGIALMNDLLRFPIPFWHPSQGFGPFSNRNQTGALMGLGAIIALGLSGSELRRSAWSSCLWIAALAFCLAALLRSNSRASLCLFLAGVAMWFICRSGITIRTVAVGGGVILLMAAVALLVGGQVVGRLREFLTEGAGLRWNIYEDTARLIAAAPLGGVGLGNFSAIFPLFRNSSLNAMRVIHPESDWLWLVSETGIGSLLFCVLVIVSLFSQPAKPACARERDVFLAGLVAVLAFLCHTFFDVPAHRLGTVLPALFVLALCTRPKLIFSGKSWGPWISRVAGMAVIALALFLLQVASVERPPRQEFARGEWHVVRTKIDQELKIAPLDWSLYLMRGSANVRAGSWVEALYDFRIARILEPKLAVVPYDEGCAWLGANPKLVVSAWKEALNRTPGDKDLFLQMLDKSMSFPEVHQSTLRLADERLNLALAALQRGYLDTTILDFVESERSELTSEQQEILDCSKSRSYAVEGDYRKAYELGSRILAKITFPQRRQMTEKDCRLALLRDPTDYSAAYNLCAILHSQERNEEMRLVLDSVINQKSCPTYFSVMKGNLLAKRGDWSEAWSAISELVVHR
jgi:hypothetical protein